MSEKKRTRKRTAYAEATESELRTCENCGGEREHELSILIREGVRREAAQSENRMRSRQPYRVYTCMYCGEEHMTEITDLS